MPTRRDPVARDVENLVVIGSGPKACGLPRNDGGRSAALPHAARASAPR